MANFDFKTATPLTSGLTSSMLVFGAQSQSASTPDIIQLSALNTYLNMTTGTITTSTPFTLTQTWNAGGIAFTGVRLNITDTASAATSVLLDLQTGSTSQFYVTKYGTMVLPTGNDTPTSGVNDICMFNGNGQAIFSKGATRVAAIGAYTDQGVLAAASSIIGFSPNNTLSGGNFVADVVLSRKAAATLQLGVADAAAPVAQTIGVQSVVGGTSNTAGADWTHNGSRGTGTGAGGRIIFKTAPAGSTGTSQNALANAFIINADGSENVCAATATPAGGSSAARLLFGTTSGFGIYYGSGAPSSLTAGQGSLYLRSDGTGVNDRMYVNNSSGSGTTWTAVVTVG